MKQAKKLLQKSDANMRQFDSALAAWRRTPRADGLSPVELFFGRRLRSHLPTLRGELASTEVTATLEKRKEARAQVKSSFDQRAHALPPCQPCQAVTLQDPRTKAWNLEGEIEEEKKGRESYTIALDDGKLTTRSRKQIRPNSTNPDV